MQGEPVITYDDQLITAITATQAATSPLVITNNADTANKRQHLVQSQRQHQVLIAGTSDGSLRKIALIPTADYSIKGVEFDSLQVDETSEPILADIHLTPPVNPQIQSPQTSDTTNNHQYIILATPYKIAKLRVNSCKAPKKSTPLTNSSIGDDCFACAQLQDPFCGWCSSSNSCSGRDECLQSSQQQLGSVHWMPFDQIKCQDYNLISPSYVALQQTSNQLIDVNIRLANVSSQPKASLTALAHQLAQAQFQCHFDYQQHLNRTSASFALKQLTPAITKANQARLNLHTSTIVIACPLPPISQRPLSSPESADQFKTKLSVRLMTSLHSNGINAEQQQLHHFLGLRPLQRDPAGQESSMSELVPTSESPTIERELTLYDCSVHSTCTGCLTAGAHSRNGAFACQWCPLSGRCTFNSSHPDLGCAASAIISSTTPHSTYLPMPSVNSVRGSHLTASLDLNQQNVFGIAFDKPSQCLPGEQPQARQTASNPQQQQQSAQQASEPSAGNSESRAKEILIPNNSKKSIQVQVSKHQLFSQQQGKRFKLECQIEVEGAKARLPAKLQQPSGDQSSVICQEQLFQYQEEMATMRSQLTVILNDHQVIETFDGKFAWAA